MAQQNVRGVQVDADARRASDPVTVLVSPRGNEYDADTWSDAYNLLSAGYAVKDGYPTGPEITLNPDADPAPGNEPPEGQANRAPAPAAPRPNPPAPAPQPGS